MLLWRVVSIALGTVTSIFLARILGPESRGTLAILMLSMSLACVIINLGSAEASIYLLGSGVTDGKVIICSLFYYYALFIAVLALPAFIFVKNITSLMPHIIILLIALTGIGILNTLLRHFLIGQKRFAQYNMSIVLNDVTFLIGVFSFWCWGRVSVSNVVATYLLSGLLVLLVSISCWFRNELHSLRVLKISIIPQALKYGFHLFITGLGGFGFMRITYFFLEFFTGSKAVGLFAAANTLPSLFTNIPQQLATVLYSHVSNSPDKEKNVQLTLLVVKFLVIMSFIFLIPVFLFAEPISLLFFGNEFAGIGKPMIILSIGMAVSGLVSVIFNALAGSSLHKYGSYMTLISLASICLFSLVLVPRIGLEGAAFSQLIAMCLSFLFIGRVFCAVFRVKPYQLFVFSRHEIKLVASMLMRDRRI